VIFGFRDVYILPAVITCAFEICRKRPGLNRRKPFYQTETKRLAKPFYSKTPRLKIGASRFLSGTVILPGIRKAQLMTVLRIILRNEAGVYADNN